MTESPGRDGVIRLEIGSNASAISIHVWAVCQQAECDWGSRSINTSAADAGVLSVTFATRERVAALKITPLPDRRLRVDWQATYADTRPSQDHTQEFAWLSSSIQAWDSPTSPNVSAGAWAAVSQSVVVFLAKQPGGHLEPVGSGLLVGHNMVATNYDVVRNIVNLQARLAAKSALSTLIDVVKVDDARAVAIVRVEGLRGWPLGLDDSSQLADKETVLVITNVANGTTSPVAVSNLGLIHGFTRIETAASFSRLESGSPVFNKSGKVVGLAAPNPEGANKPGLVIPASRLTTLMPEIASAQLVRVDSKPKPLNSPAPRYTDEARNRGIEGNVSMRILVGADGLVKQVKVLRGLPYGLDEQAIKAAYQLKFQPAMKDGQPVAYWLPVVVSFNLGRPPSRPF